MSWLFVVLVVLAVGAAVVVAFGRGAVMGEVHDDRRDVLVPVDRPIGAEDLDRVRFTTAVRGYRMDEVDALLSRLRTELADREGPPRPWGRTPEAGEQSPPGPDELRG